MTTKDLLAEQLDAEMREVDARLASLQAQAVARQAKDEMDEISGLRAAQERARAKLTDLKLQTTESIEASRREAETAVQDLKTGIDRVRERYHAWDDARERRFYARLDEAEARVKTWKAQADQERVGQAMKRHDELVALEEKITLARARAAEAARNRHDRQVQATLEEAAWYLDQAYDAAGKRYER
jgi:hypothetical protein